MNHSENFTPQQRAANLYSWGTAVFSLLFIGLFARTMSAGYTQWQAWSILTVLVFLLGSSLNSARLSRQGRHKRGIIALLGALFLAEAISSALVQGVGTALGAGMIAVTLVLATGILPQKHTTRMFLASVVMGLLGTASDLLVLPWRLTLPDTQVFSLGFSMLAAAAFVVVTFWKFRTYSLSGKLLVALVGLTMAATLGQSIFTLSSLGEVLTRNANQVLLAVAQEGAARVDRYLSSNLATVDAAAQLPLLTDYLRIPQEERPVSNLDGDVNQFMRNLRSTDPSNISGYVLMDRDGRVVKDTSGYMYPYSAQVTYAQRDFFQEPLTSGAPYISLPQFSLKPNPVTPYFYLAAPIKAPLSGEILGVLAARFQARALQDLIAAQDEQQEGDSFTVLYAPLENNFVHLAHSTRPELDLALVGPEKATRLVFLQNKGYLSLPYMETLSLENPDLLQALEDKEKFFSVPASYAHPEGEPAGEFQRSVYRGAAVSLQTAPWILTHYEPQGAILAGLRSQLRSNQLVALGIVIAATMLAVFLVQVIAQPLSQLEQATRELGEGNLDVRAPVSGDDEIGRLAATFNSMAERLKVTRNEMEERIAQRTAEALRHSTLIKTAAEVGHIVNQIREVERLLPQAAQLISERFGFYHVGIFLLDERGEYAVLKASNSLGGQRMLARGHKLKVGETGIVGYAAGQRTPRVALDVGEDAVYFDNPDLPHTRSELAVPLMVGDEVLGVLDVQSTHPNAFSTEDFDVMQALANQIAVAIANARLFARSQQALEDIRRAYGEVNRQAWDALLNAGKEVSFASIGSDALPVEAAWDDISQQVAASGRPLAVSTPDERGCYRLTLPVQSSGLTLGVISAYKSGSPWAEIEIALLENVLRELGLTLESSRLFEESQRRAQLEQASAQVVTRLRETLDIQAMLRTAAQEIRQALDLPEVSLHVTRTATDGDGNLGAE